MGTGWANVKGFFLGSFTIITAVTGLWMVCEGTESSGPVLAEPRCHALLPGIITLLLVMTWAALIIQRRTRQGTSSDFKFQGLLEAAPDAIVIMDKDSRIALVNTQTEKLFGYSRQELLGRPVADVIRKEVRPKPGSHELTEFSQADFSLGTSTDPLLQGPETFGRRKDGSEFPLEISFSPLETTDGLLVINNIRDISERQTKERRRAARHAVRRILLETTTLEKVAPKLLATIAQTLGWDLALLWVVDRHRGTLRCTGNWQSVELEAAELIALSRDPSQPPDEEVPGRVRASGTAVWVADLLHDGYSPRTEAAARAGLHGALGIPLLFGTNVFGVIEFFSREPYEPDDHLLDTMSIIGTQVGHFIRRQQVEEAVHESEARKAAILEAALDAIVTVNHEGRIVEWNPAAERMFGHTRDKILGREMSGLMVSPGRREAHGWSLTECLNRGDVPALNQRQEMTALRADGSEFPVELTVTRIQTEGAPLFTGYIRDLSERKEAEAKLAKAEEQFRQSQKMEAIGRLAGGVAHDFNNLLTIINGYCSLLLDDPAFVDPSREVIAEIAKAGDRAAGLTRQLLAFGRKQMLTFKVVDLNTIVADTSKMLQRLIGEDVKLLTVLAPTPQLVKVDAGQIEQVLMNLAVNARDAMPEGGNLTIETTLTELDETYTQGQPELGPGSYVLLAVSDNGHGMDDGVKARVFEPFFTTKGVGKGTGLGLATVYGIVKQSGGHIVVYSEVGQGTTFKVYLPLADEPAQPPSTLLRKRPAASGTETVLLVEDEDAVRSLTRHVLQLHGYQVLEARHGLEALKFCEQNQTPIHLMVTDVVMPDMNGTQLAKKMLQLHPHLKVLFLSGYTDSALSHNGVLNPDENFLQKPYTPERLIHKVREVLTGSACAT